MKEILTQIEHLISFTKGALAAIGLNNFGGGALSTLLKDLNTLHDTAKDKINDDN